MTTRLLRPEVTVSIDGDDFTVRDAAMTLDAGAVPYASATVELPLLDDATLDLLDPRDQLRVPVTAGDATGTPRVFDLGLRDRVVDHVGKTVRLTLASDEALLQDYAPLADDTTPRTLQASLRDVVDYVLDTVIPGAALESSPSTDADVTAYWAVTNLMTNPDVEGGSTGFLSASGSTAIAQNAGAGQGGVNGFLRATQTAAGGAVWLVPSATSGFNVTPGRSYALSLYSRHSTSGATITLLHRWLDENNTVIRADSSVAAALPTAWGTQFTSIQVAPPGAVKCVPYTSLAGSANTRTWDIDRCAFYEGDEIVPWFDGNEAADAAYTYAWSGTANASASTRTPVLDRPRAALTWQAGQTAWDFLMVLAATAGLVLWCDESRDWYLQTPESRTLPTLLSVSGATTRDGTDTLSREDAQTFLTGVVLRYTWTDENGNQQAAVDAAGTPEKVLLQEFSQPFPGPGAAAAMLVRRAGSGRSQDVTCITRWTATPGMTASVTLPGAPDTYGRLAAVTFNADGFMSLELSGLIDIIPGSIDALVGTIDALAGTIDSL